MKHFALKLVIGLGMLVGMGSQPFFVSKAMAADSVLAVEEPRRTNANIPGIGTANPYLVDCAGAVPEGMRCVAEGQDEIVLVKASFPDSNDLTQSFYSMGEESNEVSLYIVNDNAKAIQLPHQGGIGVIEENHWAVTLDDVFGGNDCIVIAPGAAQRLGTIQYTPEPGAMNRTLHEVQVNLSGTKVDPNAACGAPGDAFTLNTDLVGVSGTPEGNKMLKVTLAAGVVPPFLGGLVYLRPLTAGQVDRAALNQSEEQWYKLEAEFMPEYGLIKINPIYTPADYDNFFGGGNDPVGSVAFFNSLSSGNQPVNYLFGEKCLNQAQDPDSCSFFLAYGGTYDPLYDTAGHPIYTGTYTIQEKQAFQIKALDPAQFTAADLLPIYATYDLVTGDVDMKNVALRLLMSKKTFIKPADASLHLDASTRCLKNMAGDVISTHPEWDGLLPPDLMTVGTFLGDATKNNEFGPNPFRIYMNSTEDCPAGQNVFHGHPLWSPLPNATAILDTPNPPNQLGFVLASYFKMRTNTLLVPEITPYTPNAPDTTMALLMFMYIE